MRYDILTSSISKLVSMREKCLVDINGYMNTEGYVKDAQNKMADLLIDIFVIDGAIQKGQALEQNFKITEQLAEQLRSIDSLVKQPEPIDFVKWYQLCNEIAGVNGLMTVDPYAAREHFEKGVSPEEYMETQKHRKRNDNNS